MPIKDKEKRRKYDRERKRRKRAREKQAELEEQWKRGNINYDGQKRARITKKFVNWKKFKEANPNADFKDFLVQKTEFQKEHRVQPVGKISKKDAFKVEGVDLWHGNKKRRDRSLFDDRALTGDELEEHHRQADEFEEFLRQPEHKHDAPEEPLTEHGKRACEFFERELGKPEPKRTWKQDLEDAIENINKNMKSKKEDENNEDES